MRYFQLQYYSKSVLFCQLDNKKRWFRFATLQTQTIVVIYKTRLYLCLPEKYINQCQQRANANRSDPETIGGGKPVFIHFKSLLTVFSF